VNLIEQLKRDEGLRLTPYLDSVGKTTIGYGRNLSDEGITREEADMLLMNDIERTTNDLSKHLPWVASLDPVRQAVLLNMAFNMGIHGLMSFKNTLALVQRGDYAMAALGMLHSEWASQVPARAQRLAKQMELGEWQ
jgi:lysozyme